MTRLRTETDSELISLEKNFIQELEKFEKLEKQLIEKVATLEREKQAQERKIQSFSIDYGQLKSTLQHQQDLTEERDKQILAFTKRYTSAGLATGPPYTQENVRELLINSRAMLQTLKEKIAQIKEEHSQQDRILTEALDKVKEEQNVLKERISQANKQYEINQQKLVSLGNEMQKKQAFHSKLSSWQEKIATQVSACLFGDQTNSAVARGVEFYA